MFENVGWGEILVLVVAGLFILGPERLPEAAAWLGRTIRQVKDFASGARDQLRQELGPEFDELRKPLDDLRGPLRELRGLDPRRGVVSSLFDDQSGLKPNGFAPPPGGTSSGVSGAAGAAGVSGAAGALGNGDTGGNGAAAGGGVGPVRPRPLSPGEHPPIDPDAT
ncbi:MAG TPA: Sec-independent protein translocase protein TatB [Pseudonocardia sp.]